jgi:hypothetical protein
VDTDSCDFDYLMIEGYGEPDDIADPELTIEGYGEPNDVADPELTIEGYGELTPEHEEDEDDIGDRLLRREL